MEPALIEIYRHNGEGYDPFFIRDHWQVAQLNYMREQGLTAIEKMDKHLLTDEVFVLLRGMAVLIAAEESSHGFHFQCMPMKPGITYNIPANVWHNIAMDEQAEVIIIEKSGTHLGDFIYKPLSDAEKLALNARIRDVQEGP
jgi:mannose-6-phosphate isomerase-like protein (cupin superfamily)